MAVPPGSSGLLGDATFLAEAGQRVVLAENGNDGAPFARLAHHGGRQPGDLLGNAKALARKHLRVLRGRGALLVVQFGVAPDAVAEGEEVRRLLLGQPPDLVAVVRCHGRLQHVARLRSSEDSRLRRTGRTAADRS